MQKRILRVNMKGHIQNNLRRVLMICLISLIFPACLANAKSSEPILPIPQVQNIDPDRAALGEKLFHDTRLSGDGSLSCASCHQIEHYGVNLITGAADLSKGEEHYDIPTVMNVRFNISQFWDGRIRDLSEQAQAPITNPGEMNARWDQVIERLGKNADYRRQFKALYPDEGITPHSIGNAIKAYEYTLNTLNAPFDQYLRGNENAISAQQKKGYDLFKSYGCVSCHQGVNVGGNMYQRMGTFHPYFNAPDKISKRDLGRYNVTGNPDDLYVFKVPSLRLAAHTAPYFHDGSIKTLKQAIKIMAKYQVGHAINEKEIADIEAFIESLSSTVVEGY